MEAQTKHHWCGCPCMEGQTHLVLHNGLGLQHLGLQRCGHLFSGDNTTTDAARQDTAAFDNEFQVKQRHNRGHHRGKARRMALWWLLV